MEQRFSANLMTESALRQFHSVLREADKTEDTCGEVEMDIEETAGYASEYALSHIKKRKKKGRFSKKAQSDGSYSRNVSTERRAERKDKKTYEGSNPESRRLQKMQYRRELSKKKRYLNPFTANVEKEVILEKERRGAEAFIYYTRKHTSAIVIVLVIIVIAFLVCTKLSSLFNVMNLGGALIAGTSYSAEDSDIIGANDDYTALETALKEKINRTEADYPGYDEYRYDIADINHNPYVLTSFLTVLYEDFKRADVQGALQALFDKQYTLTYTPEKEVRTRTISKTRTVTDPVTGAETEESYDVEEEYDYWILNVKLTNNTMEAAVAAQGLTEDQLQRFALLNQTLGNRPDLFGSDIYSHPTTASDILKYDIPPEALSDEKFKRMITEAEKYLGFPYVWGGSSPSTSFDCSGFVSWVINHSGNGWNVGRTTAEGLRQKTSIIPADEAKPGDLIFFQGTYNTAGASHVGIYVGNGMMIHCGNPIQYASINTPYWRQHFYCYGRLN